MPLGPGVKYRWVDPGKKGGKKVRLAWKGGKVIEAKSSSGKVHTPAEFAADRKKGRLKKEYNRRRST